MPTLSTAGPFSYTGTASEISDKQSERAAVLAKRCSQPCPVGDFVKAAVGRAADRTGIPHSRLRDIWYGDARRIEAWEMERLSVGADIAEMEVALAGIEAARRRLQGSVSPLSREAIASLDYASRVLGGGADAPRRRGAKGR